MKNVYMNRYYCFVKEPLKDITEEKTSKKKKGGKKEPKTVKTTARKSTNVKKKGARKDSLDNSPMKKGNSY